MEKITTTFLALLFTFSSFAQNVDWINAPLNPVPKRANLKHQNLKGDVFQLDFVNYSRDGKWGLSAPAHGSKDNLEFDAMGRVVKDVNVYGGVTNYTYDNSANLIQEFNAFSNSTYTYDPKNRLIKMVYLDKLKKTHTTVYTYKQQKDILIINELKTTSDGKQIESEVHFKNGLKVYEKSKESNTEIITYEIDNKGNWITQTIVDERTKQPKAQSIKRDILYYDNSNKEITLRLDKIYGSFPRLVPGSYINGKKYHAAFSRFNDDYVFFDVLSKTYYVARNAYDKKNVEGQKIPLEKLLSGHEIALLFDGTNTEMADKGITVNNKIKYKFHYYWGNYFATDSIAGKKYFFPKPSLATSQKTIAVAAIDMMDDANKVLYVYHKETSAILIFDGGKLVIKPTISGFTGVNNDYVMADNNTPKYVLTDFNNNADQTIARGRYFDPAKDKLITVEPKKN